MTRVDGLATTALPVEILALDAVGSAVVGATGLHCGITRASDGFAYDFDAEEFNDDPAQDLADLVEPDYERWPGLYHLTGGFVPPADDTYTITISQIGSPLDVHNVPVSHTVVVGELVGNADLLDNLVDDLVPIVDALRTDLHAIFGTRQFRVYQVRRIWSSGQVGVGSCRVSYVREVVPPPRVKLQDAHELTPGGLMASGTCILEEISLSFSQADLLGEPLVGGEEFYYVIVEGLGQKQSRRFFIPGDHPVTDRSGAVGWSAQIRMVEPRNVVA